MPNLSPAELKIYLRGLLDDFADSESVWWRLHHKKIGVKLKKKPLELLIDSRNDSVCKLDIGPDKRLFFKFWKSVKEFKKFRHPAFYIFSVLPGENKIEVFEKDLVKPVKIFKKKWTGD